MVKNDVVLMGILNVTPDSFSDGGEFLGVEAAVRRAREMVDDGAGIIDVGGEASGPGSVDVSVEEELNRVVPVVEKIVGLGAMVSVDTWKSEVAKACVEVGAVMVNDVTALRGDEEMVKVVVESGVKVVLMYSKDSSARTTRRNVEYDDVMKTVKDFLMERVEFALAGGVKREQIILDPGMGAFVSGIGKYSWEILERLDELCELGFPVLVGASRKGFLGRAVGERLEGSLKAARMAVNGGASILRVHDVGDTKHLLEARS